MQGRQPLKEIQDWVAFNKIISEVMKEHNLCDCSDCSWSGIGVIPGRKEKHCLDHAREGKCWFYQRHQNLVDAVIQKRYGGKI